VYLIVEGILNRVEDARRGRVLRSRISEGTRRRLASAAVGAPSPGTSAPSGPVPPADGARVYRSEALVVIDVVNSTGLVTRFGNALLATLKERLERVVTPICQRHAVTYTKGTGDGYLVTFASTAQGMGALREVFAAISTMNEGLPEGAELALRAAMNFGEVIVERDSDRTGGAVHKTFRLQSVGAGELIEADGGIKRDAFPLKNYIIVSEEAASGLKRVPGVQCQFLGLCELKGFPGLHRVYQLQWTEA
jgi:class 3 adenylate cyclase